MSRRKDKPAPAADPPPPAPGRPDEPASAAEAPPPAPPRRGRRLVALAWGAGVALAAFATGLVVFNNMVMPGLVHRAGEVRVPDLSNLTFEQAEQVMREIGLQVSRGGERFDPSVPRGFIVEQDPGADTPVRGRKRVMVIVSLGEEYSSVPALFGESPRTARFLLERAGLRVGSMVRAPSERVGEGLIVDSDPPAEAVLPRDTPVHLLLSSGSGEERFIMPDLLGRDINGVRRQLESLGFSVVTPPSAPTHGAIVSQEPLAGSRITRGTTILLHAAGRVIR